ncbi:MAG: hypothetical protein ACD_40C00334G0001 [uncultured bacterium]|nr:MAG: hypothetical protein ACD_40C00334G0001 [uncultured bacterium]
MRRFKFLNYLPLVFAIAIVVNFIFANRGMWLAKYDGDYWWNHYEQSQYTQGEHSSFILSDSEYNAVKGYRLVIKGDDPSTFPAGHPPLATYFIGLSIYLFGNPYILSLLAGLLVIFFFFKISWLVTHQVLPSALITLLFASEPLLLSQFNDSLLDIYQLLFALIAIFLYFQWLKSSKTYMLLMSQFPLGLMLSTKFFLGSLPLVGALLLTTVFTGNFRRFTHHTLALILVAIGFAIGHLTYFFFHPSIVDFFRYQRYLLSWWAGSSQVPPFQVFDLIFNNSWHTWWGDKAIIQVPEWRLTWPVITALSIFAFPLSIIKKNLPFLSLCLWLIPTFILFSFSAVFPRHLLLVFPALYLLSVSTITLLPHLPNETN